MAWNYGFFNSVNGDRTYNADDINNFFSGILTAGVYEAIGNKLAVQPNGGMAIQIATGRGYFANHWVNNNDTYILTLEASDVTLNRYCAICVRVDENDGVRSAIPFLKYSDFATAPVKPTMTRSEKINEYCLAYVYIKAGATVITTSDITDTRNDSNLCGYVATTVEQVSTATAPTNIVITLDSNSWVNKRQNVVVKHMTPSKSVLVQANSDTISAYVNAGIKCSEQGTNSLTFICENVPTTDVKVDVLHSGR